MIPLQIRKPGVILIAMLLAMLGLSPVVAYHEGDDAEHGFASEHFYDRWARTDLPVEQGIVARTWMWGPEPYTEGMFEPYADSPDGERLVQYFDKSRMEITYPNRPDDNLWYVTNGLLVVEMVDGRIQVGDDDFVDSTPAQIPIAGDPNDAFGPTYADINDYGLRGEPATTVGTTLDMTLQNGSVVQDGGYAGYGVTAGYRVTVPNIDHTVASVFWGFMNSSGTVFVDGQYVENDLFPNPFYATGYPITEAYWANVLVAGTERDVLWQCFERRCMTFTPGNPEGFLVEAGNVGQHYYNWRYAEPVEPPPATETVSIFLVELEGGVGNGDLAFGCDDLLVPVDVEIEAQDTTEGRIAAAVNAMIGYEHPELYNVYEGLDMSVADVQLINGVATVNISGTFQVGGVCDEPRVIEQVAETATQFEGVDRAVVLINGAVPFPSMAIFELEGGILATFSVEGEQFKLWVTNDDTIDDILALQANPGLGTFPNGPIAYGSGAADHNLPWSWHLDPEQTEMAEVTIEVCDGRPSFVEGEVEYFVETVEQYCPWGAELVDVQDFRDNDQP
jgi:hypothetical protein